MTLVPFFLFLSGYGLYIVNMKPDGDKKRYRRVKHLYFVFWVVLLVFVPISHIVRPNEYPGTLFKLLANISGINPTYNTAMWFLLPYVLLALSAKTIVGLLSKINAAFTLSIVYIVGIFVSWWISRHTVFLNSYRLIYISLEYIALLTPFLFGMYTAKFKIFEGCKQYSLNHRWTSVAAVISLMFIVFLKLSIKIVTIQRTR